MPEIDNSRSSRGLGRTIELSIQGLIVLSIIAFSLETLPDLSAGARRALAAFEVVTIAVFTVEYIARFLAASNKLRYVFSLYGLIDLISILPFYLMLGIDLRSLRILRLFRLFRLLKLGRYTIAFRRIREAILDIKEELVVFLLACVVVLYLAGIGIYYFENAAQPDKFRSVFDGLWWALATLTTVGYGDVYPITLGGKLFTAFVLFLGLGVVAVPAGLFAAALTRALRTVQPDTETEG